MKAVGRSAFPSNVLCVVTTLSLWFTAGSSVAGPKPLVLEKAKPPQQAQVPQKTGKRPEPKIASVKPSVCLEPGAAVSLEGSGFGRIGSGLVLVVKSAKGELPVVAKGWVDTRVGFVLPEHPVIDRGSAVTVGFVAGNEWAESVAAKVCGGKAIAMKGGEKRKALAPRSTVKAKGHRNPVPKPVAGGKALALNRRSQPGPTGGEPQGGDSAPGKILADRAVLSTTTPRPGAQGMRGGGGQASVGGSYDPKSTRVELVTRDSLPSVTITIPPKDGCVDYSRSGQVMGTASVPSGVKELHLTVTPTTGGPAVARRTLTYNDPLPSQVSFTFDVAMGNSNAAIPMYVATVEAIDGVTRRVVASGSVEFRHVPGFSTMRLVSPNPLAKSHTFAEGTPIDIEVAVEPGYCRPHSYVHVSLVGGQKHWRFTERPYRVQATLPQGSYGLKILLVGENNWGIEEILTPPDFIVVGAAGESGVADVSSAECRTYENYMSADPASSAELIARKRCIESAGPPGSFRIGNVRPGKVTISFAPDGAWNSYGEESAVVELYAPPPAVPCNFECKRVDIISKPAGTLEGGGDIGGNLVRGGSCSPCGADSHATWPYQAEFNITNNIESEAAALCITRERSPAIQFFTLTKPHVGNVDIRYCFLNMLPTSTSRVRTTVLGLFSFTSSSSWEWHVDCGEDGIYARREVDFTVDVTCIPR